MKEDKLLEVFYDYTCPWCYLGTANTDRLKRERDISFRWTLFPLHPEVPLDGMELTELFRHRPPQPEESKGRIMNAAAKLGLPMIRRNRISNSRRAQELEKWAAALGKGDDFRCRTFHAYFAEGKDIAQLPVLEEIAEAVGLPRDDVWDVLAMELFAEAVHADWLRARQMGVSSIPFYLFSEESLVGYRPYEDILRLVDTAFRQ
ncbi:MAG: DsbA family protein [Desulfuromonadales bacterium]|nr:DsbA family protein [Desulfuromonadales bacterium]